jgi:hypothetical protein
MANHEHLTVKQVEKALKEAKGYLSIAAERLGCTYQTVRNYINRHQTLQDVLDAINEKQLDLSENKLISQINEGNTTAIIFHLKCKGKKRGYVEKSEVEHSGVISVTEFLNALPPATARATRELLAEELIRRRAGKKTE